MTSSTATFDTVRAQEVSKIYGRHRALGGVSIELQSGRVTALLGPNGSGKTSLLMLLSTLSRPSSGKIHFGNISPKRIAEARGQIGLLSHAAMTYAELSAQENLEFFAKLYGQAKPADVALDLLKRFDLDAHRNRRAGTFSRGMLQRLALARALIGQPKLLLLDEPFTGLDRKSTQTVIDVVDEHRKSGGMALMISHDLGVAAELGDEFIVLKRGLEVGRTDKNLDSSALRSFYAEVTA